MTDDELGKLIEEAQSYREDQDSAPRLLKAIRPHFDALRARAEQAEAERDHWKGEDAANAAAIRIATFAINAQSAEITRLTADLDAAYAAGAEAVRTAAIKAIDNHGVDLSLRWRHDTRKSDAHLEGRADASDEYAALIHALPIPPRGES